MTTQRMLAEVLFLDPNDVPTASAELNKLGFDVDVLDLVDPYGPTVWIEVTGPSELGQAQFHRWMCRTAERFGGDVVEAGPASLGPSAARRAAEQQQSEAKTS
jgi:hypothetical protein